jgi:hypothetical protein
MLPRSRSVLGWALVCVIALAPLVGCGKKASAEPTSASTPQETALAFAKALQQGKHEAAAGYWAYEAEARSQNEDWGSIPTAQKNEILAKVRENKATELRDQMGKLQAYQGELTATAQDVVVTVSGGGKAYLTVTCAKSGDGYKVLKAEPLG